MTHAGHIAFFGHNCSDAAVRRRAVAFQRAGFEVTGVMPRRGDLTPTDFTRIDLGQTRDNAYAHRVASVFRGAREAAKHGDKLRSADLFYARNLDMLAIAARTRKILGLKTPLVYECLDVHHRLTGPSLPARILRRIEGRLLDASSLLVVSSPRFEAEHFARYYPGRYDHMLVENRLIEGDAFPDRPSHPPMPVPGQLRIGWFGNLRCRQSLNVLKNLAQRFPDQVQIVLRGYPATGVFSDFEGEIADIPNITFHGRYKAPQDLARIYDEVDLIWGGDWYERGHNSVWLLPNRIYEGGYFATPALVPGGTQTAAWVADRGAGFVLNGPPEQALAAQIEALLANPEPITKVAQSLLALPRQTFVESPDTVRSLFAAAQMGAQTSQQGTHASLKPT